MAQVLRRGSLEDAGSPQHLARTSGLQKSASGGGGGGDGGVSQDAYFSELLSYSLERLSKEPELLKEDLKQLERQTQESAVTHYRAFIQTAGCLGTVADEVGAVAGHLDRLLTDMPALNAACDAFIQGASAFMAQRSQTKQLHSNHGALLELLEVPQLMDTCVRNANYDEALDLRAFVGKLALTHAELPVVAALNAEVAAISSAMLRALLSRLSGAIQLPECLRVIGYLRRLAVFGSRYAKPSQELRLRFLQCREEWLAGLLAELEEGNAYEYLKRLTDAHRLHLFDVVMQYRAIFSDDSSVQEQQSKDGGLLYGWAERRVVLYLEAVRAHLPRVTEGGSLSSVLEHCMYCGMSLARVGLDFRGLLAPVFEACIQDVFTKAVGDAVATFGAVLEVHKWVAVPTLGRRPSRAASGAVLDKEQDSKLAAGTDGDAAPPYALMEHPPLALFTNGLLGAFNELRHCAPLSLRQPLAAAVQDALARLSQTLVHYAATRTPDAPEQPLFAAACRAAARVVAPYVAACFGRVYPGSAALIDVAAATAPLTALMASWEAPPPPTSPAPTALPSAATPGVAAAAAAAGPLTAARSAVPLQLSAPAPLPAVSQLAQAADGV